MGHSKIEKTPQVPEVRELVERLSNVTESAGFEPAPLIFSQETLF